MTKKDYTAICLLVDRSGSMATIKDDAQGGINQLIKDQREVPGECTFRLAQFDTEFENVHTSLPIADVPAYVLQPRGATALNDAWGRLMVEFGEELAALEESERPDKVVFVVVTDGYENSSHEWTQEQVFAKVTEQSEQWGWEFLYLAAGQDAMAVGAGYGVQSGNTRSYAATAAGTQMAYAAASASLSSFRGGGSVTLQQGEEEK